MFAVVLQLGAALLPFEGQDRIEEEFKVKTVVPSPLLAAKNVALIIV